MKSFLLLLLLSSALNASVVRSRIAELDASSNPYLVKLESGEVVFLSKTSDLLPSLETHAAYHSEVGLELNQQREVVGMTVYYPAEKPRGGHRCTQRGAYHPKACAGFTIP